MAVAGASLWGLASGLVAGLVLALVPVPPAASEVVTVPDPRGDLMRTRPVTDAYYVAPEATEFDIIQTRFRHRHHRVRVRIQFVSLPPGTWTNLYLRGRTSDGARFNVQVLNSPGLKHVQAGVLSKGRLCHRPVHYTFDYAHDVAVIGFARSCLERPRWVRLGAYVTGDKQPNTVEDDASREQVVHEQLGHPTVSPRRLSRGSW